MATTKELYDASRARGRARYAERKEVQAQSLTHRMEAQRERAEDPVACQMACETLTAAERVLAKIDGAIEQLESLRMEVIWIALGESQHQTQRPPETDEIARDLGGLAALLEVQEMLAQKEETR